MKQAEPRERKERKEKKRKKERREGTGAAGEERKKGAENYNLVPKFFITLYIYIFYIYIINLSHIKYTIIHIPYF